MRALGLLIGFNILKSQCGTKGGWGWGHLACQSVIMLFCENPQRRTSPQRSRGDSAALCSRLQDKRLGVTDANVKSSSHQNQKEKEWVPVLSPEAALPLQALFPCTPSVMLQ